MTSDVEEKIHIKIVYRDQSVMFNTKKGKPLVRAFNAFADRINMELGQLRFHYDELRLRPENTPAELGMKDGDEIDAHLMHIGGGLKMTLNAGRFEMIVVREAVSLYS